MWLGETRNLFAENVPNVSNRHAKLIIASSRFQTIERGAVKVDTLSGLTYDQVYSLKLAFRLVYRCLGEADEYD